MCFVDPRPSMFDPKNIIDFAAIGQRRVSTRHHQIFPLDQKIYGIIPM